MVRFVVMAAGQATRMGADKLALPWRDSNILSCVLNALLSSLDILASLPGGFVNRQTEIRVVARKPKEIYLSNASATRLARWGGIWQQVPEKQPLSATIRVGLTDLSQQAQGICFIPGDQIGLVPVVLAELVEFFSMNSPDFLIPKCGDVHGSPVFFHRRYLKDLLSLNGEQGGRAVLQHYPERWRTYPVSAAFLRDVDTVEDYNKFRYEFDI